ncbi:MAG: hypothetical protein KKF77_07545 [Proteobacteria bacterium]|nr:hypothetical protein [Pseudomonadota bacterium]
MPRALFCVVVLALFLTSFPASRALAQEAPPLEADSSAKPAPLPVPPRPAAPRPAAGKPLSFKPGQSGKPVPSGPTVAKAPGATGQTLARPKARGPAVKDDGKRYLRSRDENHDGRISREEFLAGTKKRFSQMDLNRDGVLSAQEAQAAKAKLLERKAKSDARRRAQGKPGKSTVRAARGDRPVKPYLSVVDANKDGRVSRKEYLAKREKTFAELDLNHDGVISKEEAQAAKTKLLKRRGERKAVAQRKESERKAGKAARSEIRSEATASAQAPQAP